MKLMISRKKALRNIKVTLIIKKAVFTDWNGSIHTWDNKLSP